MDLTWFNVLLAFIFILSNSAAATYLGLGGIGSSLLTAALRCIVQLAVVALVLRKVFETESPWLVAGIAFWLNLMSTFETVVNKTKTRHHNMAVSVLGGMLGSTIPVSIIGIKFAMGVDPFWTPSQYIPVVGMLCGSTISGVVVAVSYVLKELQVNKDKVEMYLAFGASRMEACKPIAIEGLRLALTPTINQMSVMGLIAIPGMMTGAVLGGSPVDQAAKLQMIIIFMISASTALASIGTTLFAISTVVDNEHRIRTDRMDSRPIKAVVVEIFRQLREHYRRPGNQGELPLGRIG
ncbi:UPF0014 family [Mycena floridula]|nr:UPF0014 family [Mycena floridula]